MDYVDGSSRGKALLLPEVPPRRLLKYWDGSRVEAKGRMARSERGASPLRAATSERSRQLPFCLAPARVALILALARIARLVEMAADIGYAGPARTASRPGQRQNPQQRNPSGISTVS